MRKLLVITALIMIAGVAFSQEKTDTFKHDSTSHFLITGKLIDLQGNPYYSSNITLYFGEEGVIEFMDDGKIINPFAPTDENGKFHLKANKLLLSNWQYKFLLKYSKTGRMTYIISDMNQPTVFTIDSTVEKLDLGEIKIK